MREKKFEIKSVCLKCDSEKVELKIKNATEEPIIVAICRGCLNSDIIEIESDFD